jgi:phosphoribosylaminoimidazolecarboxamide formyltransferase/IMP cyclohydrolase
MAKRRAIVSVADKTGVTDFARALTEEGFEVLSTGGTARMLSRAGVPVTPVEEVTGFPEMMDGRVKTLHPMIHGAILGRPADPAHRKAMDEAGIVPIEVVCVGFYLFEETVAKDGTTREEAIEQIDIGGPCMVRASAKNHETVYVVTDSEQYEDVLAAIRTGDGAVELRKQLAREAYAKTSLYDAAIVEYLAETDGE